MKLRAAALGLMLFTAVPAAASPGTAAAQVFVSWRANFAPPPLPVYVQPALPGPDYVWTPGYWAWNDDVEDYYWVPGVWVLAPRPGLLWTPGWWGWGDGVYAWHGGYWGPHVGWYGGVNYGFGYTGFGFAGGYWSGPHFFYNRAVVNVTNVSITNVYTKTVVNETTVNRVSYNGGPGGVAARPTAAQLAAVAPQARVEPTQAQIAHRQMAQAMPQMRAQANHGAPPIAATPTASQFRGPGVVRAQGASPPPQGRHAGPPGQTPQYGARSADAYGRAPQPGDGQRYPGEGPATPRFAGERGPQADGRSIGEDGPGSGGEYRDDVPHRPGAASGYDGPHGPQAANRAPPTGHAPAYRPPSRPAPHPQEAKRPSAPREEGRKEER